MISFYLRFFLLFIIGSSAFAAPAKYKINPPPSADLSYSIKAVQKGINISGKGSVKWQSSPGKYSATAEVHAMLVGKILDERSEGGIDAYGLAPVLFTEKRFRKEPVTTKFDRQNKRIIFEESDKSYPLKGGEQDRHSIVWQLVSIARGAPAKFKSGLTLEFLVAGRKDADLWTFKVGNPEKIKTPEGELNTVRIVKVHSTPKSQQVELWLAPSLEWYPVKMRIAEPEGDYVEQTLEKLVRK